MSNPMPEQNGAGNLTYEQNLVRSHAGLDSLPGYVVVVFEKPDRGGEIFFRLIQPGERFPRTFRIPFWDPAKKYFSVAVNGSALSYTFATSIKLDDRIHTFDLDLHLKYRAADPQRVAELREQDPLRQLRDEITRVVGRSCAQRKWEMVRHRFRELEMVVTSSVRAGLRQYAETLGLEVISIELDRRLPEDDDEVQLLSAERKAEVEKGKFKYEQDVSRVKEKTARERAQERERAELESKYNTEKLTRQRALERELDDLERARERELQDLEHEYTVHDKRLDKKIEVQQKETIVHIADQQRQLREAQTEAIGTAVTNVGKQIRTPSELLEGFEAGQVITQRLQAGTMGTPQSNVLAPDAASGYLAAPEDRLSTLLSQANTEINKLHCPFAQQQAIRSAVLHLVAEALLDDRADEKELQKHAQRLNEINKELEPPLTRTQYSFFQTITNYEQLRNLLR